MQNLSSPVSPSGELLYLGNSGVSAMLETVDDTSTIFDTAQGRITSSAVPQHPTLRYINWGTDNRLPYHIIDLLGGSEVTAQNELFNVLTCYGGGVEFRDPETLAPSHLPELRQWAARQFLPRFFLEQITDMKYFYFAVAVIILSRDGRRITKLIHKDACYCRLQKANAEGRIENVFYADWQSSQQSEPEIIPLLDERDPLGDLLQRLGREPSPSGRYRQPTKDRKFAILMRFPTAASQYYPTPYYASIFRGGSYDEMQLISTAKRAKLRNFSSVKYHVEVERSYWGRILQEAGITDPLKRKERIKREKENIRDFISNIDNSDKVWISGYYVDPDGHTVKDVVISCISTPKEGGDWADDIQAAANTACYAFNVHPNLVGAVPGKAQSNNSGSDKRELFTIKQALEKAFHDILLQSLQVVCQFNGWDVIPSIPMLMLTTLDEHTDAKKVSTN